MKDLQHIELGAKNFIIHFDKDREVGGLMFGTMYRSDKKGFGDVKAIVQLQNKSKRNDRYILPNAFICFLKSLKYLFKGYELLGEWHSHPTGYIHPSKIDNIMMFKKAKRQFNKIYRLGIITDKGKLRVYEYDYNDLKIPKVIKAPKI